MANGVDPRIPMEAGRGALGAQPQQVDLFAPMREVAQTMSTLNQVRQQNAVFGARQHLGEIWATSPDPETAMARIQQSPAIGFAPELLTQAREAAMMLSQQRRIEQEIGVSGNQALWQTVMPQVMQNPTQQTFENATRLWAATQPDGPEKTRTMAAFGDLQHALLDGLPSDPVAARTAFNQKAGGFLMASGMSQDHISALTGQPVTITTPGGDILGWRAGLLGAGVPGTSSAVAPGGMVPGGQLVTPGMAPSWQAVGGVPQAVPGVAPTVTAAPAQPLAPAAPVTGTPTTAAPGGASAVAAPTGAPASPAPTMAPAPAAMGTGLPQVRVPVEQMRIQGITQKGIDFADAHMRELTARVDAERQTMQRSHEMRGLMHQVQTGPQQAWRQPLANLAARMGAAPDLVNRVAGGDFAAAQELQKFFVTTTMGQLRSQLPSGSRLNLQEWTAFTRNNPNLETDPNAIEKIFNFWTRQFNFNNAELTQFGDYLNRGNDPYRWGPEWTQRSRDQGFIRDIETTGEVRGTTPAAGEGAAKPTARWNPQTQRLEPVQ